MFDDDLEHDVETSLCQIGAKVVVVFIIPNTIFLYVALFSIYFLHIYLFYCFILQIRLFLITRREKILTWTLYFLKKISTGNESLVLQVLQLFTIMN